MSGKKEQRTEGSRVSDKMIDIHREYLDMDTDEEDFGRQESPEVEEDLPPEPEKPVFSEADLITLVQYVKDLTIFPSSGNKHWNENSTGIIREYFENPAHELLSIFHKENKLTAALNLPDCAPKGFVYFLRSPWQIYTPDNFFSTVSFGSITNSVLRSVLKFTENIYAPSMLRNDDYTPFIKNEVFSNLHEFVIHLSEEVYKPMNLTTLYVPKENLLNTFPELPNKIDCFLLGEDERTFSEENEKKRNLVGRLDKVVWSWIRQMDEATRVVTAGKRIRNIQEEVNYWNAKHSNLNYLHAQLLNPEVRLIVDVLGNLCASSANKFEVLDTRIATRLKETSSNLMHLYILFDSFKNLNVPDDTENSITEALLLILFIWTESPFYNNTNSIEILCQALSLQVISQCKKYIKLDVALGSNPEEGMKMLKKCILCCDTYRVIYNNIIRNVIPCISPDKKWNVSEEDVFNTIDTFKQRCYDVIEICEALIIFGRYNKMGSLGSPKGIAYEAYWRKIENLFYESLDEIIAACDIIFDITRSGWLKKIKRFRYTVLQLEIMIVNLINDIFKYVKNVEEGIEAIYALQKFKEKENLREILQNKWIQVWKIFSDEIEYCYTNAINMSKKCDPSMQNVNVNISMLCISQYLKTQHDIMMNALDWIGDCTTKKCILEQYKHVLDVIDERRKMFNTYGTRGIW